MATAANPAAPPAIQQNQEQVNQLLQTLQTAVKQPKKQAPFHVRSSTFTIPGTDRPISAWKFGEYDFSKGVLPVQARGLFVVQDAAGNHRIAVRGYDKFFNIGEVPRTRWDNIASHTKPPYEVTLKENGCIIFLAGLEDGTLLVCSKNSIGDRGDTGVSHARTGEKWLDRQLEVRGRTREELARALYKANATAVAELCDDEFEEHILPYAKEDAGLYLHGVNLNLPEFVTYNMDQVEVFANEWGFQKVKHFNMDSVEKLRSFLEETERTGAWEGRDVEGFVIRCKNNYGTPNGEWEDWFFKYKFEEPYLMYRQWRECTKAMIAGRTPRINKHKEITQQYLKFAAAWFKERPGADKRYQQNHGIITLRNAFLESRGIKNTDIIQEAKQESVEKLVLVPIATIGCGKTTVATALSNLFGWGHKQNDDNTAKTRKSEAFARSISQELVDKPVVIADRNNSSFREREQLRNDIVPPAPTHYVALHYVHDSSNIDAIRAATQARVFERGDNHQTIQAASEDKRKVQKIMESFINRFQPCNTGADPDSMFKLRIDLDPIKPSRENLETVVTALHTHYPQFVPRIPAPAELDAAIAAALKYTPTVKHTIKARPQKPQSDPSKKVDYFRISLPTAPVLALLDKTFEPLPPADRAFYDKLKAENKLLPALHVTLIHSTSRRAAPDLWSRYVDAWLAKSKAPFGNARVTLDKIVWDENRLMCATVRIAGEDANGREWTCANDVPHITLGLEKDVRPKESNDVLEWWRAGAGADVIREVDVAAPADVWGVVDAAGSF